MTTAKTEKRPGPPDLIFHAPDCPMCSRETDSDGDGYSCPDCGAYWSYSGDDGEWTEPDEPQCASTGGTSQGKYPEQCLKSENHIDGPDAATRAHASRSHQWGEGVHSLLGRELTPPDPEDTRRMRALRREAIARVQRRKEVAAARRHAQQVAAKWNAKYPIGTTVTYWPHGRGNHRGGVSVVTGVTTGPATAIDGHLVSVDISTSVRPIPIQDITEVTTLDDHQPVNASEDTLVCRVCRTEVCTARERLGLPAVGVREGEWGPASEATGEDPF